MADTAPESTPSAPAAAPPAGGPAQLRVATDQLPQGHLALARALSEAGVGGQELTGVFATGLRGTCVGCGMTITGAELGEVTMAAAEEGQHRLTPKLERLRLGYCPRQGCEARFFMLELAPHGRFEPAKVTARAQELLSGSSSRLVFTPTVSPETRRKFGRLVLIALATALVALVVWRLVFYRSRPIPFVKPQSPFTVDPASVEPVSR